MYTIRAVGGQWKPSFFPRLPLAAPETQRGWNRWDRAFLLRLPGREHLSHPTRIRWATWAAKGSPWHESDGGQTGPNHPPHAEVWSGLRRPRPRKPLSWAFKLYSPRRFRHCVCGEPRLDPCGVNHGAPSLGAGRVISLAFIRAFFPPLGVVEW